MLNFIAHLLKRPRINLKVDFFGSVLRKLVRVWYHWKWFLKLYNLSYSDSNNYNPKNPGIQPIHWSRGWRVFDLLIQFYDPLLYRFLKSTQRDIARRAVHWIKSLFRAQLTNDDVTHSLWDIIFQSVDPLLPLWIRLVKLGFPHAL